MEQFEDECSGQLAWKALIDKYEQKGAVAAVDLHRDLMKCRLGETEDPDSFFVRIESLQRRLKALGQSVTDEMLAAMILSKLPSNYDTLGAILESGNNGDAFKYDQMKERIRAYFNRRIIDSVGEDGDNGGKALLATDATRGKDQRPVCFGCGEPGHIKFNCPKKAVQGGSGDWRGLGRYRGGGGRSGRGRFGGRQHQRGGGRGYGGNQDRGSGNYKGPSKLKCYTCNKEGHKAQDCPGKHVDKANTVTTTGDSEEASIALAASDGEVIWMAKERSSSIGGNKGTEASSWVVDSGCTSHMTSSEEGLTKIKWTTGKVVVADGKTLESIGVGTMDAMVCDQQGKATTVSFNEVLIVPRLGRNLLSVKKIVGRGGKVVFAGAESYIEVNLTRLPLKARGKLYELEYEGRPIDSGGSKTQKVDQAFAIRTAKDSWRVWHSRLCHVHAESLAKLGKLDVGLPSNIRSMIATEKGTVCCDICEISKHTHASFRSIGRTRATKPFELVHMDVFGPVDTTSLGGAKYGILFKDDYSRWITIDFMTAKSESLDKLKAYIGNIYELTRGRFKVRGLHSGNGGEFISMGFKRYCQRKGIRRTYTAPRAPQQNGIVERANRTVMDMARCIRLESGLEKELWAEACSTAVYVLNRVPSAPLDGDTPYHRLHGEHAKLEHLRTFGCQAYIQTYKEQRCKLDPKAWRGILVGYDDYTRRCYRVYDPVRKVVVRTVHVTFNEKVLPAADDNQQARTDRPTFTIAVQYQQEDADKAEG